MKKNKNSKKLPGIEFYKDNNDDSEDYGYESIEAIE